MKKILFFLAAVMLVTAVATAKEERVSICHKGEQITVAESAVQAHLKHGDTLANPCGCGFDGIVQPLCGGKTVLCIPNNGICAVGCIDCCPVCVCPPEDPNCPCNDPPGPECNGASCACFPEDCGCFVVAL